ncbi:Protein of uncharacterised function (DUF1469) [Kingella potus]|uniref:Protein of uncharacterized function (DUF1469) n=1 Tax=Kingella potus TaxID=265175 RepID=A0A377QZY1_9NEIS|nr:phage holin family protein [Kingella potus]UOP00898.1 phage holin family protein [Kingella potus]STR00552.1 Protein of uncharacterised function (DUF1469) [Kingella potus]
MGIKDEIGHTKTLFDKGTDLLLLRLRLLSLDMAEQAESTFKIALSLLLAAVCLFAAVLALMFGLNRLLDGTAALAVFFSTAFLCLLAAFLSFRRIASVWRVQNENMAAAIQGIRDDIACLRGETAKKKERGDE